MENKKKRAAVIAAVMSYIRSEEDIISMQAMSGGAKQEPVVPVRLWGTSARQVMMQTRNLMQMKTFHGVKPR